MDCDDVWLPDKLEAQLTIMWTSPDEAWFMRITKWWIRMEQRILAERTRLRLDYLIQSAKSRHSMIFFALSHPPKGDA